MWKRATIITLAAVALSTLGIQASDMFRGIDTELTALVSESSGPCQSGATLMLNGERALCVDNYEASASDSCTHTDPKSGIETKVNFDDPACLPESKPDSLPWRFVSQTEAQQLCARVGKRLPTSDEWYRFSSGLTNIDECVIDSRQAATTGNCSSPLGVFDSIGNVWEWLDEEVTNGNFHDRTLPPSGYVSGVDTSGVALVTSENPDPAYGDDYVTVSNDGVRGMIRGGFYGSKQDAGIYALNAAVQLDLRTAGIGFRCVEDVRV